MKGRILLIHVFFDMPGGAEFLALNIARTFRERGFDVTILTCTPVDVGEVKKIFNIDVSDFNIVVRRVPVADVVKRVLRGKFSRLRRLMVYKRFFTEYMDEVGKGYDLVMETQSNVVSPADISYIHYPALIYFCEGKSKGLYWKLYDWTIRLYASSFKYVPGSILTNSTWTAAQIYRVYHIVADVVYPPVDVEYFTRVADSGRREKLVITISRFTEEKRLDKIVDVAARLRDYTFVLIGSTYEHSYRVLDEIERKVKEYRLDNVIIETNLPRAKMLKYLKDARFYLHPPYAEHFSIAVVEAMAAGLVPIVYRDGGTWHDVVSKVWNSLGYEVIEETPKIIQRIDSDCSLYEKLRRRSIEISRTFSYKNFKQSITKKVEYVLKVKRIASSHRGS